MIEILWLVAVAWLVFLVVGLVLTMFYVAGMLIFHAIEIYREGVRDNA